MKLILYLLYKFYDRGGTKGIAYSSSLGAILLMLFINLMTIGKLAGFNVTPYHSDNYFAKFLVLGGLYFVPGYFILGMIFSKDDILNQQPSKLALQVGTIGIALYFVVSIIVMIYSMLS